MQYSLSRVATLLVGHSDHIGDVLEIPHESEIYHCAIYKGHDILKQGVIPSW